MKKLIFAVLLLSSSTIAFSQTKNFIDQPYLETSAKADTLVTPDRIYLSILIAEKDTKGKISIEKQENEMAKSLEKLGIDFEEQLALTDLTSNFKKYFLKQKDVHKSKSYTLLVYDGLTAGKVIQALEKINISNVGIDKIEYSEIEQLQLQLKSKAIKKAKTNAEYLINPLGQKIGNAIHISDEYNNYRINEYEDVHFMISRKSSAYTHEPLDVDFEKIKVESSVSVKFIIQ